MEILKKYWWAIAAVVLFMTMGKKKSASRPGARTRKRMRALKIANARMRAQMMRRRR